MPASHLTRNVNCATALNRTLSLVVSGITSGTVSVNEANKPQDLNAFGNGTSAFATQYLDGTTYSLTLTAQPAGHVCYFAGATGVVNGSNKLVDIECHPKAWVSENRTSVYFSSLDLESGERVALAWSENDTGSNTCSTPYKKVIYGTYDATSGEFSSSTLVHSDNFTSGPSAVQVAASSAANIYATREWDDDPDSNNDCAELNSEYYFVASGTNIAGTQTTLGYASFQDLFIDPTNGQEFPLAVGSMGNIYSTNSLGNTTTIGTSFGTTDSVDGGKLDPSRKGLSGKTL